MRKLLFGVVIMFCVNFVYAQDDGYELEDTVIKEKEDTYDNIDYLEKNFGHLQPGEIIKIEPDKVIQQTEEQAEEPKIPAQTQASEDVERTGSSHNVTSSSSNRSSSARKSSSRKRSKRKKIGFKRKRPNKIKRKPKLGNRAACPRF